MSYLVILFLLAQGISLWKSRNAFSGNLSGFHVQLINGDLFPLSQFTGEPVLLHFWATWCPVCALEDNSIQSISDDYPVVTVASWSEDQATVTDYLRENNLTFPVMLDNNGQVATSFGLKGVPSSFILSPDGDVRFVETGYTSEIGLRIRLWLATL